MKSPGRLQVRSNVESNGWNRIKPWGSVELKDRNRVARLTKPRSWRWGATHERVAWSESWITLQSCRWQVRRGWPTPLQWRWPCPRPPLETSPHRHVPPPRWNRSIPAHYSLLSSLRPRPVPPATLSFPQHQLPFRLLQTQIVPPHQHIDHRRNSSRTQTNLPKSLSLDPTESRIFTPGPTPPAQPHPTPSQQLLNTGSLLDSNLEYQLLLNSMLKTRKKITSQTESVSQSVSQFTELGPTATKKYSLSIDWNHNSKLCSVQPTSLATQTLALFLPVDALNSL